MATLIVHMLGKTYRETFDHPSDAALAVRAAGKRHGLAVLPNTTESGEDLGTGKLIRVSTNTTMGSFAITEGK